MVGESFRNLAATAAKAIPDALLWDGGDLIRFHYVSDPGDRTVLKDQAR
jgi:hypothetical protein